jgi:hypothetical protein
MPRKNRSTALVLVLALLACLAGQAAAAMPVNPRQALNDTATGGFFSPFWGWLANRWADLGQAVAGAQPGGGVWEKGAGATDPNGQPHSCEHLGEQGSLQP